MYLLWIFSDARHAGKSYQLPAQMNWSGRLDISDDVLGDSDGPALPVTSEGGAWSLHLPEGFRWEDGLLVKAKGPAEMLSSYGRKINVIDR